MSGSTIAWGVEQRFFLPNEDARPVAAAMALQPEPPRRPVFVGGSGLLLLEALARTGGDPRATFVDVAPFQVKYFSEVVGTVQAARTSADLRWWFAEETYPRLRAHYRERGQDYSLDAALRAMRELFGLSLFFEDASLARARLIARTTAVRREEIGRYLARTEERHDFIYLSNVVDYLDGDALDRLLEACRRHNAPVYVLVTSACPDPEGFLAASEAAGFTRDPRSCSLDEQNHGLGSRALDRSWNRPGTIHLLVPHSTPGGER